MHVAVPPALYCPVVHAVQDGFAVLFPAAPYFALQFTIYVHVGYAEPFQYRIDFSAVVVPPVIVFAEHDL